MDVELLVDHTYLFLERKSGKSGIARIFSVASSGEFDFIDLVSGEAFRFYSYMSGVFLLEEMKEVLVSEKGIIVAGKEGTNVCLESIAKVLAVYGGVSVDVIPSSITGGYSISDVSWSTSG